MSEMEYQTNFQSTNDQKSSLVSFKHRVASFLWSIPEPAAHSAAFQLVRMDMDKGGFRRLDRSTALCFGLIGLAVLEEMI